MIRPTEEYSQRGVHSWAGAEGCASDLEIQKQLRQVCEENMSRVWDERLSVGIRTNL